MKETADPSPIDRSALEQIRRLDNEGAGLPGKVVDLYLSGSSRLLGQMRAFAEAGDAEALRRAAHTLKSGSANVGAAGVAGICRRIEEETAAGGIPPAGDPLLSALEEEYILVRRALEDVLAAGRSERKGDM